MASSDTVYRYRSFVMGAVQSSGSFLAATVAELRADAADPSVGIAVAGLAAPQCTALATALDTRASVLDQYQVALRTVGKEKFKADAQPYRSAALVVVLRNFLVHFPAEWLAAPDGEAGPIPQRELPLIERQLKRQFGTTAFADPSRPFFPDHCLSAACARWAAESTLAFVQAFCTRAGVAMTHHRPILRGV